MVGFCAVSPFRLPGEPVNLLVICPHFDPDVAPTGVVMSRIAHELIARGHRLHVVTSLPWYQHHAIDPGWEGQLVRTERTECACVRRLHGTRDNRRNVQPRATRRRVGDVAAPHAGYGWTDGGNGKACASGFQYPGCLP